MLDILRLINNKVGRMMWDIQLYKGLLYKLVKTKEDAELIKEAYDNVISGGDCFDTPESITDSATFLKHLYDDFEKSGDTE